MQQYHVIGLMSGTSLDGLDMAYCVFSHNNGQWHFSIKTADTFDYTQEWLKKLQSAPALSGQELLKLHNEYGDYMGRLVARFIKTHTIKKVDFVASHGHTVFHQPKQKFTFQLGSGAAIAAACMLPVICDFRSLDVALNGQGAPLVPIGDKLLFSEYGCCINLGGFANISYDKGSERIAFDICPVNIMLNHLAAALGKQYDKNGRIAASGKTDKNLLQKLNALSYYSQKSPKSLGREWVEKNFLPLIEKSKASIEDKLATVTEHAAKQVAIAAKGKGKVLLTGGGAFNTFLVKKLESELGMQQVVVPPGEIVKYKEALVFAFLGVLRHEGKENCLNSVTGADKNNKGGVTWLV